MRQCSIVVRGGSEMPKIQIDGFRCSRCDHEWVPRGGKPPVACPKCNSAYWPYPRKAQKTEEDNND